MVSASIFDIIIGKFCYKKKPYSIILLKVNKNLKVNFYYIIPSINMAICLRIKGGW